MSEMLTADAFRRDRKLPIERVEVPELGGHCFVRTLVCKERDAWEAGNAKRNKDGSQDQNSASIRGRLAVLVICDEAGKRILGDDAWREVDEWDGKAITRILIAARELNGMDVDAQEKAEKNSENGRSDASSSSSPAT